MNKTEGTHVEFTVYADDGGCLSLHERCVSFLLHVVNVYICGWILRSSCLFEQNLQLRLVVGCLNRCRGWAARECAEREAQNRERGHFFGVSHYGERLGSNPAGLTALSRNVCDWRPGWGMHCAVPYASKAERPRDVICLMESVLVFLLHHGMCFHLQQWRPHSRCNMLCLCFDPCVLLFKC